MKQIERSICWTAVLVLLIAVIILLLRGCHTHGSGSQAPDTISKKTTVSVDSFRENLHPDTSTWHNDPVAISVVQGGAITIHDTFSRPVDTAAIVADYNLKRTYEETFRFPDIGRITVESSVTGNNLVAQRAFIDSFQREIIVKTITNTDVLKNPPKARFYAGITAQGSQGSFLSGVGPSLMLITKKEKAYEFTPIYMINGRWIFQGSAKFPLSIKK